MEYIRQSLGEDEELIHIARFHWMYSVSAAFNIVFGAVLAIGIIILSIKFQPAIYGEIPDELNLIDQIKLIHPTLKIVSFLVFILSVLKFAHMMIIKATTEIGITDCRLVYKRGLVARAVGEINIDRIEGVNVLQGIWGRVFGYGRVMVRGMGVGEVVLPPVAQPIRFKKAIEKARSKAKKKNIGLNNNSI